MEQQKKTLDILQVKDAFFSEIGKIPLENRSYASIPEVSFSSEDISIDFITGQISQEIILNCIQTLSQTIENWRIYSIDTGYLCLQSPFNKGFESKYGAESLKVRFTLYSDKCKVSCSKKQEMISSELLSILNLYKYLSSLSNSEKLDPYETLTQLGVSVYDPLEEEKRGNQIGFDRIAGYGTIKKEIQEAIIFPLQHPDFFDKIGRFTKKFPTKNRPRAILFEGDPGVGKTTMAKIVSAECKIPLIYVPIETILSKYYGESSQNLAMVFDAAAQFSSCLLFLDEIDSLAGSREGGMFDATRKLLSVLLRKLDGFEVKSGTITIGATNRKKDLDSALLSRFDKAIYFPLPNHPERKEILKTYAQHLNEDECIDLSEEMEGLSGRNIKDYCDSVERKWATFLLKNSKEAIAPPFRFYYETLKLDFIKEIDT